VSADEQLNFTEMEESMTASVALNNPVAFDRPTAQLSLSSSHISLEDRKNLEEEREKLFQLLDAKDDEIQEQSQLVEKLKEQMLEQEELIVGTRRDYENLSKEMNKIQVSLSYSIGLNKKNHYCK
jgi:kinesin family protein 5